MNRLPVQRGTLAWYQTGPTDARPVVWVQGLPLDSRAWSKQEQHFRKLSRNVFIDLRGYGESSKLPSGLTDVTQLYVDDVHALVRYLGLRNIALVGFASAGHVALRYAAQHPDVVGDLITINGSPRFRRGADWPWGFDENSIAHFVDAARTGGIRAITDAVLDPSQVFRDVDQATGARLKAWFEPMSMQAGVATLLGFFEAISQDDDRGLLASITARALVIASTAGQEVPAEVGLYLRQHIPRARLAELPGVDHFAFATRPALVNQLIEQTLSSCEAGPPRQASE